MKQTLRMALMVLLAAATGVGNALGEWDLYSKGGIKWQYELIDATRCRIRIPVSNRSSISGSVTIPSYLDPDVFYFTVVEIAEEAFENCRGLTAVTIPDGVTKIGKRAFAWCSRLKSFEVESGNKKYCAAGGVLFTKDKATLICYPGGKAKEFYTIPGSVTEIGEYAFAGCDGLKEVTIPGSVTEIGEYAFAWCSRLKSFEVESGNKKYCAAGGVLFTKDKATLICYPGGKAEESYTIPGSVTEIGEYAFAGCDGLKDVTIPGSVTEIRASAFSSCSGLTAVSIPSSVTEIGNWAFSSCSGLNAVYWLADANCSVEYYAFKGIASPATLYVRQGEKEKIEGNGQTWWQVFSKIEEGYVVIFTDSDGIKLGEQLVKPDNGTATAPTAPAKEGYIVEWQHDGKKYDFSKPVTQNITLVAVWKKKEESTPSTPKDPETAVESVQLAEVRVVRNPVGEALELEGLERAARVEVYSVVGARVYAEALRGEPRVTIDARGWVHGVYVVRVAASDGERTLRVVK